MSSHAITGCPKCGQDVDTDSRFCKHCGFDLSQVSQRPQAQAIPTEEGVTAPTAPQKRFNFAKALLVGVAWLLYLPVAGVLFAQVFRHLRVNNILVFHGEEIAAAVLAMVSSIIIFPILIFVKRKSFFKQRLVSMPQGDHSHNLPPAQQPITSSGQRTQALKILGTLAVLGLLAVIGVASLAWYISYRVNDDRIVFEPASGSNTSETYTGKLTNGVAERAVQRWCKRGSVDVAGVQELPQQNSAVAQLKFTDLYYKANGRDNLTYSGPAEAVFVHYNDGRWMLSKITIGRGFDAVVFSNINIEAN